MHTKDLHALAALGARIRLEELLIERATILKAFPEIDGAGVTRDQARDRPRRRRRPMTAAQRKMIGARMRQYWAQRREAHKGPRANSRRIRSE